MNEFAYDELKERMIKTLSTCLNPKLTYHNLNHSLDVLEQATTIAREENIRNLSDLKLLQLASIYHDSGFLHTYKGHEQVSCEIFLKDFKDSGLSDENKKAVCGMIMATKIPQSPKNLLESIICDADLDYLGRPDFYPISERLRDEFLEFGIVQNIMEWEILQIRFFENHNYFTSYSKQKREPLKLQHLKVLQTNLNR